MNIGKKIIELRKKQNFTQEKLAEKLKISRQTLSSWESGITSPNLEQAGVLAKTLKISLDELVDNDLDIVCSNNIKKNIFGNLVGKKCYFNFISEEEFFDVTCDCNKPCKVLDINSDFIKIEYTKRKEKHIKLIDIDLISAIKVEED